MLGMWRKSIVSVEILLSVGLMPISAVRAGGVSDAMTNTPYDFNKPELSGEQEMQSRCPDDKVVLLNARTNRYFLATQDYVGDISESSYVCRKDADNAGINESAQYSTIAAAQHHCPKDIVVWVDNETKTAVSSDKSKAYSTGGFECKREGIANEDISAVLVDVGGPRVYPLHPGQYQYYWQAQKHCPNDVVVYEDNKRGVAIPVQADSVASDSDDGGFACGRDSPSHGIQPYGED